ncbi:MAG TPA: MlaD family protein [Solirubrobacteraceae bacterium]|nr:MlaD family protein [Solirubrobacteraceae bacterium]
MSFARGPRPGQRRRLHPIVVALLVIAVTAAVTYYAFNKSLPFGHPFNAYAVVTNSVNVRGGDPVRIGGVDVGQVRTVMPDGPNTRIGFTLQASAQPVHRDATIRIRDRLFLEGSYYLQLDPGTPGAPLLHSGAVIPPSQTSSPVQFFQVLSLFNAQARQGLTTAIENLNQGFGAAPGQPIQAGGAGGLKHAAPQLAPLLQDTALISQGFQGTKQGDVHSFLSGFAGVARTLADSSAQLTDLVHGLSLTSSALAASDGALAQTVSGLDQTLIAAPPALSAVDNSLGPVTNLARSLDPSLLAAPPILDQLIPTVRQLAAVLAPGSRGPLLAAISATFRDLPSVLTQLAAAFPIGKPISDCLRTHVVPIANAQVPDGSLSSGQSVLQDFMHFLPGVAGASGSFDGNGAYTRFLVGAGTNTLSLNFNGQPLVATSPPGGGSLQGARPQWFGDLTASDFHPEVPCATQKVPSLASGTAAPDLVPGASGGLPGPANLAKVAALLRGKPSRPAGGAAQLGSSALPARPAAPAGSSAPAGSTPLAGPTPPTGSAQPVSPTQPSATIQKLLQAVGLP